jgi:hypothetical protein
LELGAAEGAERRAARAEEDEPVALGSAGLLVGDDAAVLELAEARECGAQVLGAGAPAEAVDEELPAGGVGLRGAAHGRHRGGARLRRRAEQRDELLPRQRLEQLGDVLGVVLIVAGAVVLVLVGGSGLGRVVGDGEVDGAAGLGLRGRRLLAVVACGCLRGGGGLGGIGLALLRRHREAS